MQLHIAFLEDCDIVGPEAKNLTIKFDGVDYAASQAAIMDALKDRATDVSVYPAAFSCFADGNYLSFDPGVILINRPVTGGLDTEDYQPTPEDLAQMFNFAVIIKNLLVEEA